MSIKSFIVGTMALSSFLLADFATEVSPLYSNYQDTKVIGKLLPTAEVKILQKKGNWVKVQISGYQDENKPVLYYTAGKRILNAAFDSKAGISFKKIKTQKIEGKDYTWSEVEAWMDEKYLSDKLQPLLNQAKSLFEQNCSICHGLHKPKEFSANQWPSMFKSMAGRTGIEKKDYQLVIQYLQKNAKDIQQQKDEK